MNPAPPPSAATAVPATHTLRWHSESDTQAFAARLAQALGLHGGDAFIALHGDLGAGKTTLVRHVLRALGVGGRIKSPTYAVVESYDLPGFAAWHLDFYRFNNAQEFEDAGLREIFTNPGLKLAEWPEKAAPHLPVADWDVFLLSTGDASRTVHVHIGSARGEQLWTAGTEP